MRAQFIRGEDPKEQMNIGSKIVQLEKRMERAARIICRDYKLDLDTIVTRKDDRGMGVEFDGKQPNRLYPYRYWIFYDFEREHFWVGYTYIPKDEIGDQKPTDSLEKSMLEIRIYLNKFNGHAEGGVKESLDFERGQAPMDSMNLGRVKERKMKAAYKQMKEACKEMMKEWKGEPPYMKIVENMHKDFMEIGIEYTPGGSSYFYYLVYAADPASEEIGTHWAAGYRINHRSKWPSSPNAPTDEQDEIPYDTLEEAINKMKYWYQNL